jgi:hypothetical protein
MSTVPRTIWDIIWDITSIRSFIASHSTADDQHELLTQLQNPHEPQEIKVQSFCCCLRKVNGCVEWMPGTEPRLNEGQMTQAFFQASSREDSSLHSFHGH